MQLNCLNYSSHDIGSDSNNPSQPHYTILGINAVFLAGLGLTAYRFRTAYYAYQEDLQKSHAIHNCFTNPIEFNRVINLCTRLGIALKEISIETLNDKLREVAEVLYQRQKCRLTFLCGNETKKLNRDLVNIILDLADMQPKLPYLS